VLTTEDDERRAVADQTERAERTDQQRTHDELVQTTRRLLALAAAG